MELSRIMVTTVSARTFLSRRFSKDLGFLVALAATGLKMQIFVRTTNLQNRFGKSLYQILI